MSASAIVLERSTVRRQRNDNTSQTTTTSKALRANSQTTKKKSQTEIPQEQQQQQEVGSGTYQDPFRLARRTTAPNKSDCWLCPTEVCDCAFFTQCLQEALEEVSSKRITSQAGRRDLCAKSILPPFMNRMIRIMDMISSATTSSSSNKKNKTFFDFGSGNGSVLFYFAWTTGMDCVGVELSPHNAAHAKQLWAALKPKLEKRRSVWRRSATAASANARIGDVTIICGDICDFLRTHMLKTVAGKNIIRSQKPPSTHGQDTITSAYDMNKISKIFDEANKNQIYIWTANLLMPKSVTHFMAECFRKLPVGSKIMAFDDLYPHGRAVARVRDPEAFELFEMVDFMWQLGSVEWTEHVEGMFHLYIRK